MKNIINKLKVSRPQKDLFVILLISFVSIYSFFVAWNQTSFSDDVPVALLRVIQSTERIPDQHEKLRVYDSLRTVINSYLVKKPTNIYLNYFLAYLYAQENDYPKAITAYRNNLSRLDSVKNNEIYSGSKVALARCHYLNGVKLIAQGDSALGVSSILQSFIYVPYYANAVVTIAQLDINNNRADSGKKMVAESLKVNPKNVELLNTSGYIYYVEGDFKQAESFFMQAYKLDPGNVEANKFLTLIKDQSAK
jgi:cytochrome c-type biogenesis protein CcmH/NrfG